jgi:pectin-derived oligosaccharide transport system substrate-binding protein
MQNQVTRRGFLKWSGAGMALMAAAACTPSAPAGGGGNASGGNEPKSLNVAQWGTAQRADLYKSALDLFQQNNPGVTTNLQFADLSSYNDRLTTQAASKSLPDVLWMRDDRIGLYGGSKALLDLSPYLSKTIMTNALSATAVDDGKVGNGVYALPSHYVGQCVIVNSSYLESKGIKYAEQVKTWDDLAALARQLNDPGSKMWGINDPTLDTTQRHLQAWIRQAGQELFATDGSLGFTADTFATWLEFWDKLRKDNIIPPADVQTQAVAGGMATNTIVTNQTAMILASSNGLTQVQRLTQTPLAMFSIPEVAGGSKDWWFFPPILLSIAANTKSPQLSASLVEFFMNSVPAGKLTRVDQGAPSSSAIRDALLPDLAPPEAAFVQQISREMTYPARPLPVLPQASAAVIQAQIDAGQQVAFGKQSVSQAVDAFMATAKKATGK